MAEYHNPNQGPGMDRRMLMAMAGIFLLLMLLQPLLMKKKPEQQQPGQQPTAAQPAAPAAAATIAPPPVTPAPGGKQAAGETTTVIENDLYRITFTNRGAQVRSWVLKKFKDNQGNPLELVNTTAQVQLQQDGNSTLQPAVNQYGYPLSLWTYDENLRNKLNSALYVPSAEGQLASPANLSFEYADGDLVVRKSYSFDHSYVIKVATEVFKGGQLVQAFTAWPAGFGDQTAPASYAASSVDFQYGDQVTRMASKKVSGGATVPGPFNWAAVTDQYFGAAFLPDKPDDAVLVTLHSGGVLPKTPEKSDSKELIPVSLLGIAAGNAHGPTTGRWFVGPKATDVIDGIRSAPASSQSVGPTLATMLDFGRFFGIIAKPLFLSLKWTYRNIVSNWGWAIAALTTIIYALLLPLRISSMKSALKMQKVQPLVNEIKKKYEKFSMKDPRRAEMNREISVLFKEHNVNPVGGCLPMIVQMPFLIAFWTMLNVSIELRHAGWLWIKDLSSPDPYHIFPVAIVVSTWLMQKMTPTPGMDPAQARMMNLMMPVMLGFFSWNYAAGISLYWLLGTIISIVTQVVLNNTTLGREMKAVAEKRARRKATKS